MTTSNGAVLQVRGLKKHFPVARSFLGRTRQYLKAVDGISLEIEPGMTYGLVGESGCGKTTTAKLILLLEEPTDGQILFGGQSVFRVDRGRSQGLQGVGAGRLPGPVGLAEPQDARQWYRGRAP